MRRAVVSGELAEGGDIRLDEATAHYLARVLRVRAGEEVELVDAAGRLFRGRLQEVEGGWEVQGLGLGGASEPEGRLVLVASLIRGPRQDWMFEKATELGATEIVPLRAARSQGAEAGRGSRGRVERWQRLCDQASRQCGRLARTRVSEACDWREALAKTEGTVRLHLDEEGPLRAWPAVEGEISVFVGPEGGFTEEERRRLREAGASAVGLGGNLLRAETAALAALAAVRLRRERVW